MTHQAGERAVNAIARRLHDDSKYGTYASHEDVIARFERTLREMGVGEAFEALRPFAEFGQYMVDRPRKGLHDELYSWDGRMFLRQSDLLRATAALDKVLKAGG